MRRNNLVFDVGLHRGEDTRFYLAKGFDVVAVEAMPDLARRAAEELRDYVDSGQLVIENVAIAEEAGPFPSTSIRPRSGERFGRTGLGASNASDHRRRVASPCRRCPSATCSSGTASPTT